MASCKKENKDTGRLFEQLVGIIARLRDPDGGCPWDLEQTHESLKTFAVEEAYEVVEAIESSPGKLPEELGDLLLQVVLHSQIGSESGNFDIDRVLQSISEKLIRRHPHVFASTKVNGTSEVLKNWEKLKGQERQIGSGLLNDLPKSLPALYKAHRIGEKVARVGFDWKDPQAVEEKVQEELKEFSESWQKTPRNQTEIAEEFGDLLFTLAQLARKMGFNSEELLSQANNKFCARFKEMEKLAGDDLKTASTAQLEALWGQAKKQIGR